MLLESFPFREKESSQAHNSSKTGRVVGGTYVCTFKKQKSEQQGTGSQVPVLELRGREQGQRRN